MKAGKSVSLDTRIWMAIESYRRKNGLSTISSAVEAILEKKLKEIGEIK